MELSRFKSQNCLNAQPKPARHCSLTLYFDSTTKNMTALIWRGQILEAGGSARRLARLLQPGTIARRSISSAVPSKGPWQSFVRLARSGRIVWLSTSLIPIHSHQSRSRNNVSAILYASAYMYVHCSMCPGYCFKGHVKLMYKLADICRACTTA